MQRFLSTLFLFLLLTLTACGSQPAATATSGAEIDLATLPVLVDPQTANLLRERDDVLLIDVREQAEYDAGHIPGITLIPMGEIPSRLADIPKDKTVIVSCQSGRRSSQIASFLQEQGFTNIHDLDGGFSAWQRAGLPVEQ
ncbi:MAG: rhodanese-like domain-containing protein [Caldilinea sp. CFX5]|nr:rhodanese-like domain-containing protein [Caldilinea sp. CFX5]